MKKRTTLYLVASIVLAMPILILSMDEPENSGSEESIALSSKEPIPFRASQEIGLGTALSESAKARKRAQIKENCSHITERSSDADAAQIALEFLRSPDSGQITPDILSPRSPDQTSPLRCARSLSEGSTATVQITYPDGTRLPNETRRFDMPPASPSNSQKKLQQTFASGAIQTDRKQPDSTITPPDTLPKAFSNSQKPTPQTPEQTQPGITKKPDTTSKPDDTQNTSLQKPSLWMEFTKAGISIAAFAAFLYYMKWLPDSAIQTFDTYLSKLSNLVFLDTSATDQ